MSYIECSQCGQRALSIATRCPRCGHEFSPHSLQRRAAKPARRQVAPVLRIAGVLVAVVVLVVVVRLGARLVTGRSAEAPSPPEESITSQLGRPAVDTSASPPERRQLLRYATTWVNVRASRSRHARVDYVLEPGEAVMVDSLILGWYRVAMDGQTLGYAARPYFDSSPPPVHP